MREGELGRGLRRRPGERPGSGQGPGGSEAASARRAMPWLCRSGMELVAEDAMGRKNGIVHSHKDLCSGSLGSMTNPGLSVGIEA